MYKRIDPKEEDLASLLFLNLVQLVAIILVITVVHRTFPLDQDAFFFLRFGLMTSQIFLLGYAVKRIGKLVYHRDDSLTHMFG
jgi:hypothetical protein